jgi:prepilin-type N-terminal cleavage/methylation domain-containing protein
MTHRRGMTLIELVVAMSVVALITAISALAGGRAAQASDDERFAATIASLRARALIDGHSQVAIIERNGEPRLMSALPDGRILADSAVLIDPFSGTLDVRK